MAKGKTEVFNNHPILNSSIY